MKHSLYTLILMSAFACGNRDSADDERAPLSELDDIDPIEDVSEPPEEAPAGQGTIWVCTLGGWGDDGGTYFEFEDVLEFCFEGDSQASSFVNTWSGDCADAFQSDGFFNYECNADCVPTSTGC